MKGLILKLVVLNIIQVLILSQLVFAQNSFEDSFDNEDGQIESATTNPAAFGLDVSFDDVYAIEAVQ
mgnify:CR=1 FL=1